MAPQKKRAHLLSRTAHMIKADRNKFPAKLTEKIGQKLLKIGTSNQLERTKAILIL
jgi:hypothetical protein